MGDIWVGERILQAILHLSAAEGCRITYEDFGARVAAAERKQKGRHAAGLPRLEITLLKVACARSGR